MGVDIEVIMGEYQLADNYLLMQSEGSDSPTIVSNGKRVVHVNDSQTGSYSGLVNFDFNSQLMGSKGFASPADAYLLMPYVVTMKSGGAAFQKAVNRFAVGLKCGVWNVIDSLNVEMDGKTLISEGDFKLYWNNLRAQTEWTENDLKKTGADSFVGLDDWSSIGFNNSATPAESTTASSANGDGYYNNQTNLNAIPGLVPEYVQVGENSGFIKRLYGNPSPVLYSDTGNAINPYGWNSQRSGASRDIAVQNGKGAFTAAATPSANTVVATWYHMLKIRLVDLHPVFKSLELIGNPTLKIRMRVNTGYVDISTSHSATGGIASSPIQSMSLSGATIAPGNTCPIMIASASKDNALYGTLPTSASTFRVAFGVMNNNLTTIATSTAFYPFNNCRIMLPVYDIVNPSSIVSNPIKRTTFLDCSAQIFKGRCGIGGLSKQHNAPFSFQLSGTFKNAKYVCLLPFAETSASTESLSYNHWATAHGTEQYKSPFDSAPWTVQPGSSIRAFQVQVGNQSVFSRNHDYDFESFRDEFMKMGAINGGLDHSFSNGLIDAQKWATAHRVMVADVSRISSHDVPQSIVVSGVNAACQGIDVIVMVIYERDLSYNRITGECQIDTTM